MTTPVSYELRQGAAWITLNSPENHNALSDGLVLGLQSAITRAQNETNARAIVLASVGPTFCAGADLKNSGGTTVGRPSTTKINPTEPSPPQHAPFVETLLALWRSPKPVIGRVQGNAWGGGLGLIACCDQVIMADSAKMAFTEVRLGLIPAVISVFCARKILYTHLAPLMLSGRRFDASRALELGLAHEVVQAGELDRHVQDFVQDLQRCGPKALGEVRQLLEVISTHNMDEALTYAQDTIGRLFRSTEGQEGMTAFRQKRPPTWRQPKAS